MAEPASILVLAGDGIGPEVVAAGVSVLEHVSHAAGIPLQVEEDLIGGASYDRYGTFCRNEVVQKAMVADGVIVGAVGGPKWDAIAIEGTPMDKDGLVRLRKELDTFACLRPAISYRSLFRCSPFREDVVAGVDVMVLRELCGGIYFGEPRGVHQTADDEFEAFDANFYTSDEIARVARVGFALARRRRGNLVSVDKANVMESGVLWRRVVTAIGAREFPDVTLRHLYADNALFQLVRTPRSFDVILGDNLFGDLISDLAAAFAGSLGMLPSASLRELRPRGERCGPGIYEPVHGSAPDIAGKGIANPLGTILSVAMLFDYGLGRPDLADMINAAVERTLAGAELTPDLGGSAGTEAVTAAVLRHLS